MTRTIPSEESVFVSRKNVCGGQLSFGWPKHPNKRHLRLVSEEGGRCSESRSRCPMEALFYALFARRCGQSCSQNLGRLHHLKLTCLPPLYSRILLGGSAMFRPLRPGLLPLAWFWNRSLRCLRAQWIPTQPGRSEPPLRRCSGTLWLTGFGSGDGVMTVRHET